MFCIQNYSHHSNHPLTSSRGLQGRDWAELYTGFIGAL